MTQINRWLLRFLTVIAIMTLASCATPNYIPDQNSVKNMSVGEARSLIESHLPNSHFFYQTSFGGRKVLSARVKPGGIEITTDDNRNTFLSLSNTVITSINSGNICGLLIDDGKNAKSSFTILNVNPNDITNALFVLSRSESKLRSMASMDNVGLHFDVTVRAYRDASPKPTLPEDARRFKVQAEGAVADKQFESAADYYEQAIEIAPWWPEGHFNRALVLSETKDYDLAIIEMKRYLLLVPNAPDARAVQDKIYDWERKASTSN